MINRQPLPPRKWSSWIKPGHPRERELREDANFFWRWLPGACPTREWARRGREPASEPAALAMMIQAEVARQLDALQRRPQAEPARPDESKQPQGPKVVIPRKQYRKMKGGK